MYVCYSQCPEQKKELTPIVRQVHKCLFDMPIADSKLDRDPSIIHPPLCKSQYSRRSGYFLLTQLLSQCEENIRTFIELFMPLHYISHSGGTQPDEWEFESKSEEKSETGYVGLRNLGCIW